MCIRDSEQLQRRLAEVKHDLAASGAGERLPETNDVPKEPIVEYLNLELEIRDRHRDELAAIAYQPPDWVTSTLGERPADHERQAAWDAAVDRALQYRTDHDIPDDATDLLGPQPPSSDVIERVAWIVAERAIQREIRLLTTGQVHRRSAIGR